MKHFIPAMLAVAILSVPIGAFAGEPSAPEGHSMHFGMADKLQLSASQQQTMDQLMKQTGAQMEQLHAQARAKILGSLTPAHRALLAQVIGNLAVSANPDEAAAVRQIDAALSPGEASAVLSTHAALKQQAMAIMSATHQKFMAILTPQQRAQLPAEGQEPNRMYGPEGKEAGGMEKLTAGAILVHFAGSGGEEHHMMFMGHP